MLFNMKGKGMYKNATTENCIDSFYTLLPGLTQKERETLTANHTYANFKKGEVIFHEGERPLGLLFLVSGKVKVYKNGVGGREQILRMVKPVSFMGYRSIFTETTYSAHALAIEDATICIFEKDSFIKILRKNPEVSLKFVQLMSDELRFSNDRTVSLTQKHIRGRLAESLIVLKDTYGFESDGRTMKVYLSREDIANLSNMTTSNAIRTLSTFASEEVIQLEGRKIKILDPVRLDRISELG